MKYALSSKQISRKQPRFILGIIVEMKSLSGTGLGDMVLTAIPPPKNLSRIISLFNEIAVFSKSPPPKEDE
ncbi:MAG: hypothetical protein IKC51_02665 [Myxococcaceae bacterium]|nr:hypothetical protein [Myxococcaceae bacterium]